MSVTYNQAQQGAASLATHSRATPQKAPSTPTNQTTQEAESAPSTGTWRHPRFDEITRRQHASTFGDQNVRTILWNLLLLILTLVFSSYLTLLPSYLLNPTTKLLARLSPYPSYALLATRLLLATNILLALRPLFAKKDDLHDIPLTPSQRALLGLDPSAAPATPGSRYVTPPRYARSSPRAASNSPLSNRESSPGRRRGSPLGASVLSNSPFSPAASPLLQKAVGGGASRRLSLGGQAQLSPMGFGAGFGTSASGTPTPGMGRGPSVAVNQRWLYEKGMGASGRGFYS